MKITSEYKIVIKLEIKIFITSNINIEMEMQGMEKIDEKTYRIELDNKMEQTPNKSKKTVQMGQERKKLIELVKQLRGRQI